MEVPELPLNVTDELPRRAGARAVIRTITPPGCNASPAAGTFPEAASASRCRRGMVRSPARHRRPRENRRVSGGQGSSPSVLSPQGTGAPRGGRRANAELSICPAWAGPLSAGRYKQEARAGPTEGAACGPRGGGCWCPRSPRCPHQQEGVRSPQGDNGLCPVPRPQAASRKDAARTGWVSLAPAPPPGWSSGDPAAARPGREPRGHLRHRFCSCAGTRGPRPLTTSLPSLP